MNDLLKMLENAILTGRSLHAYLLTGSDPMMTDDAARSAASLMLYSYVDTERLRNDPDYMEYSGTVSISDFRDVIRPEIYRETFAKAGRVVVFRAADRLSQMVQNAMLKVLEEPPEKTHFILTGNEYGILPTIRSRCMIIRCALPQTDELIGVIIEKGAGEKDARFYASAGGGVTARALKLYEDESFRELRLGALKAFFSALGGVPDMKWTRGKRDRSEWTEANEFLLLAGHDIMRVMCGMSPEYCPDAEREIKNVCSRFTFREIGSIINKLTENAMRLSTNASGGASFDRTFAELASLALSVKTSAKTKK